MSNVYILEPPTSGKVLLKTTVGDIDIELWSKETPKTCRNFIQLCLEGYYNNTIFHRVVHDFIVQGGDPLGDGTGGKSIYGEPFKDEFHQRLKFVRRGLLAMANAGKDDNGSQFFFTLGPTAELQNKHTIFGKVVGDTVFNMLKLAEGLIEGERPVYPHKILKAEVLHNPFPDIEPRVKQQEVKEKRKKEKKAGVKDFKLLSFGAEAEEDEEESTKQNEIFMSKGKSSHDVLDDPKLSSATLEKKEDEEEEIDPAEQLENIRKKLKTNHNKKDKEKKKTKPVVTVDDDDDAAINDYLFQDREEEKKKQVEELRKQMKDIKQEYQKNRLKKETEEKIENKKDEEKSETFKEYQTVYDKYTEKKKTLPKKGAGREQFTLALLEKFKKKLHSAKENEDDDEEEATEEKPQDGDLDKEENWLSHKLHFKEDEAVLARDANTKDDDWFEIYDPRNPLNKRRRGENSSKSSKK